MFIKSLLAAGILLFTAGKPQPKITWVAIGDSITYLNDHPDETGNRVKKGYMTRVLEQLPQLDYRNQGHNGWTSGGIAEKFDELRVDNGAVYTIFLGTNDWWQGRPVGTIEDYTSNRDNKTICSSFGIIISKIREINPQAAIILITPLQRMDFVYLFDAKNNAWGSYKPKNGQSLEQVANAIKAIGELEKIPVVDLYHDPALSIENAVHFKRMKNPKTGKYTDYKYPASNAIPNGAAGDEYPYPEKAINMTYDGLHPSDKGNARIAELLSPVLAASTSSSSNADKRMIRIAQIEVDSAYLQPYHAAIEKHTKAAIANEPGVLTLYVLAEKNNPTHITVVEIYASTEAYQNHLKTPHFQEYKQGTLHMVKSLKLIDMNALALGAQASLFQSLNDPDQGLSR